MAVPKKETIPDLLLKSISRQLVLGIEEAFIVGAQRAFAASRGMHDGHLSHVVGHLRHFHMNETFHNALAANNAAPTPIQGNVIVTGRVGVFNVGRFNAKDRLWNNARRSKRRVELSMANKAIEPLVQPALFSEYAEPTEAVVFFVASFANSLRIQPDTPVTIEVAVPDPNFRRWLFREPLERFILRYDQPVSVQNDLARPKLKKNIREKVTKDGTMQ